MARNDYCEIAALKFYSFAQYYDETSAPPSAYDNYSNLQDYVAAWVEEGDAIEVCGGNYATFLSGVLVAMSQLIVDPSMLAYRGESPPRQREVEPALDLDSASADIMDERQWERWTFERLTSRE